ncbi:copper chaperone PCu(A)C [Leucobacter luti]|nr:copper chaperone PCu(A)C [Leucobacter luti]
MRPTRRLLALSGAALAAGLLLTGCSTTPATSDTNGAAQETSAATAASSFEIVDGWAKAGDGMTGVFGSLTNSGDSDLTLTSVASPAAAMVELHETVVSGGSSVMREVDGGFVIPAGGSFELEPGGNHIMFMDLPKPLLAGDEVELTLTFDDGSTVETSVLVKDYDGAQENYEDIEDSDGGSHGDMSSDEHAG